MFLLVYKKKEKEKEKEKKDNLVIFLLPQKSERLPQKGFRT